MTSSLGDALSKLLGGDASPLADGDTTEPAGDRPGGTGSSGTAGAAKALDGLTGVRAEVTGILLRVLGEDAPEEAPAVDSTLRKDLGMDRLAVVEFVVRTEEETGVLIKDDDAAKFRTLGDVIDYVDDARGE